MSPTVRPARPSDRAVCVALWRALHDEHQALDARYRIDPSAADRWRTDFHDWVRSDAAGVWLAVGGGEPVGLIVAHAYETAPVYVPERILFVSDLYVALPWRGRGVGRALLAAARAWGDAGGLGQTRAGVLAANADGLAFWERAGATPFSVTVTIDAGHAEGD